jgi:hypothetical protein
MTVPISTAAPNSTPAPNSTAAPNSTPAPNTDGVPVLVPLPGMRPAGPRPDEAFTVDCADCCHRQTSVCDDCVVSFIVDRQPDDAVVVDAEEARAVRLLERAGLVPGVRHSRRASGH